MKLLSDRIMPILYAIVSELAKLSWAAMIVMLCIGGVLVMLGNEHGGKKVCKNGIYGFIIIQLASMLL